MSLSSNQSGDRSSAVIIPFAARRREQALVKALLDCMDALASLSLVDVVDNRMKDSALQLLEQANEALDAFRPHARDTAIATRLAALSKWDGVPRLQDWLGRSTPFVLR
jgi:hypothetical protein